MRHLLFLVAALVATGCPSADVDPGEGVGGPTVEFDPANRVIPFPNDLARTGPGGTIALPEACGETAAAKAIREGVLNKLDGFGTYQAGMQVTFTEPVDATSLVGRVVVKRASGGVAVEPAMAQPIAEQALIIGPRETTRVGPDCAAAPVTVSAVTIVPAAPLEPSSTYVVALGEGVKTADGRDFAASFTWALVREAESPVVVDAMGNVIANRTPLDPNDAEQLAQLRGLSGLWNAHAQGLGFLEAIGVARDDAGRLGVHDADDDRAARSRGGGLAGIGDRRVAARGRRSRSSRSPGIARRRRRSRSATAATATPSAS